MYLLAKLTGLAGIILSAGTAVTFLFPYFQKQKLNSISNLLYDENSSVHDFDFKNLEEQAEKNIQLLNEKIEKLKNAKDETNRWSRKIYEHILTIFEYLSNVEKWLTNLYEEIISEIKKLVERNKEISKAQADKLTNQKGQKMNYIFAKTYTELINTFSTWKNSINQINCAINKNKDCQTNEADLHKVPASGGASIRAVYLKKIWRGQKERSEN